MVKPIYNRIAFEYGGQNGGLQETVNGFETRLLTLTGEPLTLPDAYGYSVVEENVAPPANAPDIETSPSLPDPPQGYTYILVPSV